MPHLDIVSPERAFAETIQEQTNPHGLWGGIAIRDYPSLETATTAWSAARPDAVVIDSLAFAPNFRLPALPPNCENLPVLVVGDGPHDAVEWICETLPKPVRLGQLLGRALFHIQISPHKGRSEITHTLGPWRFAVREKTLTSSSPEQCVKLTDMESALLEHLLENGEPVSREALLGAVWGYGDNLDTHTLETHIYRLRRKLSCPQGPFADKDVLLVDSGCYRLNPEWLL